MMLIIQIAKLKSQQYQMITTSPNFMLTKIIRYTVYKLNNQITTKLIFVVVSVRVCVWEGSRVNVDNEALLYKTLGSYSSKAEVM